MNLLTIGLVLLILTFELTSGQDQSQQQQQQQDGTISTTTSMSLPLMASVKGQQQKSPIIRPPSKGVRVPAVPKPTKGTIQDHTEIIPLNPDEEEDESEDDGEPIVGENKRVPVPITPALVSLARRLRSMNGQMEEQSDDGDPKHNWWQRKDLRLRKAQKKLDPEEQQMMELMYGGFHF